jgi:hypothetical protein
VGVSSGLLNGFVSGYGQLEVVIIKFLESHKDNAHTPKEMRQNLGLKRNDPIFNAILAFAFPLILSGVIKTNQQQTLGA